MTDKIDTAERRRRLQTRHLLTAGARTDDVAAVADAVVTLHATDLATVYLSAWARMTAGTQTEIADAIYGRKRLVRMMGMRRTMFVVADRLAPVVHASSSLAVAATQRRLLVTHLRQAGVDDAANWLDEVSASTLAALTLGRRTRHRPGRRRTAPEHHPDADLREVLAVPQKITSRVLTVLALQGRIVRGAPLGSWTSNRNEWWPAADWMPGGFGELDPVQARTQLAARWLLAFGPDPLEDLKWWTGWTPGPVRTALTDVPTFEVDLSSRTGLILADGIEPTPRNRTDRRPPTHPRPDADGLGRSRVVPRRPPGATV